MHNVDWDNIRFFLAVVRHGSVSRAAVQLGVNQTTVSRRIATLEAHLRKELFDRTGSGFVLTPVAERLVTSAKNMAEEASTIERHVLADSHELSGELRITVADLCTQRLVIPALQAFTQQYPEVDLNIIATRDVLDLTAREADVALRSTDEPPPNLVGTRITALAYAIYGSQEIAARVQTNPDSGDIPCITWLGDGHTRPPWIDRSFPKTRRIYRSTELSVMYEMTRQGIGMTQMPCALCDPDPLLQRIPCHYVEPGWGLWVLSHVDLRTTARVRIFRDFLVDALNRQKDLIEGKSFRQAR